MEIDGDVSAADGRRDERRWSEAAEGYRRVLSREPERAEIWVQLGHCLKEDGDLAGAETAYATALLHEPEAADTHLQMGHVHKLMGRRSEAERDYLAALDLQPDFKHALTELAQFGWTPRRVRARSAEAGAVARAGATPDLVLELSDLLRFLQGARHPTGIQRVQVALARALDVESEASFVVHDGERAAFVELDRRQLSLLLELAGDGGSIAERVRRATELAGELRRSDSFSFPHAAVLLDVGASWSAPNHPLAVREAKRCSAILYAPLVHDCIPLLHPELCDQSSVRDYVAWFSEVFDYADLLICNSENTLKDVEHWSHHLGTDLPPKIVVRLDGSSRAHDPIASAGLLEAHGLDLEKFVLLTSTFEPRKNHALVLDTWAKMLDDAEGRPVPRLVCAGSSGWLNEAVRQQLARDARLEERVLFLRNVDEASLQQLYERCLFTIFPSLYEGWGLPISEALDHGRTPLVSDIASHREAGGEAAVYFQLGSQADFRSKLERLIHDADHRAERRAKIAQSPPARSWRAVAAELVTSVVGIASRPPSPERAQAPPLSCGRIYSAARSLAPRLHELNWSAEPFRSGRGWLAPGADGCAFRSAGGELRFRIEDEGRDFILSVCIQGSGADEERVRLSLPAAAWGRVASLTDGAAKWERIRLRIAAGADREVRLRLSAMSSAGLLDETEPVDGGRSGFTLRALHLSRFDDLPARQAFIDAVALDDFSEIGRRFPDVAVLT